MKKGALPLLRIIFASVAVLILAGASAFVSVVRSHRPYATILLYHSVTSGEKTGAPSISLALFTRQMAHLAGHRFTTVFIDEIAAMQASGKKVPGSWVALTFDGGYDDFYYNAFPVLKRYGLKATVFVVTSALGQEGSLTAGQLKEMAGSGLVRVGSHSHVHLSATCLSPNSAWREKRLSREILEKTLGTKVTVYAYPYGAVDRRAELLARQAGYTAAVGITYRLGKFRLNDRYNLRRAYVSDISRLPFAFRFMLSGYYVPSRGLLLRLLNIDAPRDAVCG